MALTRHEQLYYNNIERIATALEKMVAQGKEDNLDRFKKAANLIYGNTATVNPGKGRSDENYTYPEFVDKHYKDKESKSTMSSFRPNIQSDLDARIHKESQSITGGEFSSWHNALTAEERESYSRVYGH